MTRSKIIQAAAEKIVFLRQGSPAGLVSMKDLKGLVHVHTVFSDGVNMLEEMAEGARKCGYTYLVAVVPSTPLPQPSTARMCSQFGNKWSWHRPGREFRECGSLVGGRGRRSQRRASVTDRKTILVIDDEYGIAELLQFALEDANYRVLTAPNGKMGLAIAQNELPDLVLLDVMMPIMDGPATLRALQANEALREIPVVMMSSINETSVRALCEGFAAFVRKPFHLDALFSLVEKMMPR